MIKTINELEDFDAQELERWCHANISSDVFYTGEGKGAYYLELARDYLEKFLPNSIASDYKLTNNALDNLTPIQYAALLGYNHFLSVLPPQDSATIDHPTTNGMTALHLAATAGNSHCVTTLLNKGADASVLNNANQSPLVKALFLPEYADDMEKLITQKELIFKQLNQAHPGHLLDQDNCGYTVFHEMAVNGFEGLLKESIQQSPEGIFISDNQFKYPIHRAILMGQRNIISLLLTDPNLDQKVSALTDSKGRNALHYAAKYATGDSLDILKCCVDATKDINTEDNYGNTALMLAVKAMHTDVIAYLINQPNVSINQKNKEGYSPLTYLRKELHTNPKFSVIEHLLLEKGAELGTNNNMFDKQTN